MLRHQALDNVQRMTTDVVLILEIKVLAKGLCDKRDIDEVDVCFGAELLNRSHNDVFAHQSSPK